MKIKVFTTPSKFFLFKNIKQMSTFDARNLKLSIDKNKLKLLYKVRWQKFIFDMITDWALIVGTILVSELYFNPFLYAIAVVIIGARMHALTVLMHDVSHYRFLNNKKLGDLIINLFVCWPMFITVASYRQNHLLHHQHLNTQEDPDWISKINRAEFRHPQNRKQFLIRLLLYFLCVQGIKDLVWIFRRLKKSSPKKKQWGGAIYIVLLGVLISFFGCWKIYLMYWIVPLFTTMMMFHYIRSFAEHFGDLKYENLLNSTRTVNANLIEKFFIAPHNIHYHLEHHLYPGVPYHNLPKLKKILLKDNSYKALAHYSNGYLLGLLREL